MILIGKPLCLLLFGYRHLLRWWGIDFYDFPLVTGWVVKHVHSTRYHIPQRILVYLELGYHKLSCLMIFLVRFLWVLLWRSLDFLIIVFVIVVGRFVCSFTLLKVLVDWWAQGFVLDESIQSIDFTFIMMVVMVSRCLQVVLTQYKLTRDHWWPRMNLLLSIVILWNSDYLRFLFNMARCISL